MWKKVNRLLEEEERRSFTMEDFKIELLNHNNETDIVGYERGLYDLYIEEKKSEWYRQNYIFTDDNRLKPFLDYSDMLIYLAKLEGKVVGSLTYNLNMGKQSQIGKFGFDRSFTNQECEGLGLNVFAGRKYINKIAYNIMMAGLKGIHDRGFTNMYSTVLKKLKAFYELQGFIVIDKIKLDEDTRYLLKCSPKDILEERKVL